MSAARDEDLASYPENRARLQEVSGLVLEIFGWFFFVCWVVGGGGGWGGMALRVVVTAASPLVVSCRETTHRKHIHTHQVVLWVTSSARQAAAAGAWGEAIGAETAEAVDGGGGGSFAAAAAAAAASASSSSSSLQPPPPSRSNSLTGGADVGSGGDGGGLLWIVLPMLAAVLPLAPPAAQQTALTKARGCGGCCLMELTFLFSPSLVT